MGMYDFYLRYYKSMDSLILCHTFCRYPSKYIDTYVQEFFKEHISMSSFLPLINDVNQFSTLRNKLFTQPSVKEIQTSRQIINIEVNKDNQPNKKSEKTLVLHYTHEKRLDSIKRDIHKIYSEVFKDTEASDIRLMVAHRNSRNTQLELVHKQPYHAFVKIKQVKSKLFLLYINKILVFQKKLYIFRIINLTLNDTSNNNCSKQHNTHEKNFSTNVDRQSTYH